MLGLLPAVPVHAGMPMLLSPDKKLKARMISFTALPKWDQDHHEKALEAFKRSCRVMGKTNQTRRRPGFTGTYADWADRKSVV